MTTKASGRRRWTLAVCVVLAAVALVAVAFQGAPRFSGPRMFLPPAPVRSPGSAPQQSGSPAPRGATHEVHLDLSWLLVALVVLAVVIGLAVLWRLRRRPSRPLELTPLDAIGVAETSEMQTDQRQEPEPEQVRRGLDRAADALAEPREPRDAIEAAWVGLEEGAADSGVRRLPAETPAEFAARVVARVAADREAAARLLALYLRARFSSAPVTAADVAAAADAVDALRASWSAGSGSRTGDRRGGRA